MLTLIVIEHVFSLITDYEKRVSTYSVEPTREGAGSRRRTEWQHSTKYCTSLSQRLVCPCDESVAVLEICTTLTLYRTHVYGVRQQYERLYTWILVSEFVVSGFLHEELAKNFSPQLYVVNIGVPEVHTDSSRQIIVKRNSSE